MQVANQPCGLTVNHCFVLITVPRQYIDKKVITFVRSCIINPAVNY